MAAFLLAACLSALVLATDCNGGTVVVNVARGGHDIDRCLLGDLAGESAINCSSLSFALGAVELASAAGNETEIHVWYPHVLVNASGTHRLRGIANVEVVGHGRPLITCRGLGNGFGFEESVNISVRGLGWRDCSIDHPTAASLSKHPQHAFHRAYSALFFFNCTNVVITNCNFTSSFGSGVSMYDVVGIVEVTFSDFFDHHVAAAMRCPISQHRVPGANTTVLTCSPQAVGLYIEAMYCTAFTTCQVTHSVVLHSKFKISHCNFERNTNPEAFGAFPTLLSPSDHWPFGRGGGLAIVMRAYEVSYNSFTIEHCSFSHNNALWAGGVFVKFLTYYPINNTVTIRNCTFYDNSAEYSGGGIRIGMIIASEGHGSYFPNNSMNEYSLKELNFTLNTANWGGGLSLYSNPTRALRFNMTVSNCRWVNNTAIIASSAVGITRWDAQVNTSLAIISPVFHNCSFYSNIIAMPQNGKGQRHGFGTVYTEAVPLVFSGTTVFDSNRGSALVISSTMVTFVDSVVFSNGHALLGGAIHLTGSSWVTLTPNVQVLFVNNTALQFGGAIFFVFPPSLALSDSEGCFLRYFVSGSIHVPLNQWAVNLTYVDNSALIGGHAIFLTDLTECVQPLYDGGNPFNLSSTKRFIYHQNQTDLVIATSAQRMNFTSKTPGAITTVDDWTTYAISPGEAFDLTAYTTDYYGKRIQTVYSITCSSLSDYKAIDVTSEETYCVEGSGSPYQLHGGNVFTSNTVMSSLKLAAPFSESTPDDDSFVLKFTTFDDFLIIGALRINFVPCRLGLTYDNETQMCQCFPSSLISCQTNGAGRVTPILQQNYWYGHIHVDNSTKYVVNNCLEESCAPCQKFSDSFDLGCIIPTSPEDFCTHDRTGPLCSQCQPNLSLTYDGYGCSNCNAGKKIGLAILILVYWVAVIGEIILLVKCNVAMGSAGFYAILYFYSIVKYVYRLRFPFSLGPVLYILVAFTQLDPYFLAYTNFCLFDSATSIHYYAIHFVHPVAIALILFLLYRIDRCGIRVNILSGDNAIPAVCILILISYTSLASTAMHLLDPLAFDDAKTDKQDSAHLFVRVQPDTAYFDPRKHLPFALLALFVEFGLIIPFTVFMLVAPWLAKRVNLTRIKPILDEYQSCFHDEHRYFAGVYLLARQLFFLTSISAINLHLSLYLQQLISLGLFTLHTFVQPYRKHWLNTVDMLILLDACLLTFNVGATAEQGYEGGRGSVVREVIVTALTFAPVGFVVVVVVSRLFQKCRPETGVRIKRRLTVFRTTSINDPSDASEENLPELRDETPEAMRQFPSSEKEPLLARRTSAPDGPSSGLKEGSGRGQESVCDPTGRASKPTNVGTVQIPYQSCFIQPNPMTE